MYFFRLGEGGTETELIICYILLIHKHKIIGTLYMDRGEGSRK